MVVTVVFGVLLGERIRIFRIDWAVTTILELRLLIVAWVIYIVSVPSVVGCSVVGMLTGV